MKCWTMVRKVLALHVAVSFTFDRNAKSMEPVPFPPIRICTISKHIECFDPVIMVRLTLIILNQRMFICACFA